MTATFFAASLTSPDMSDNISSRGDAFVHGNAFARVGVNRE